MSSECKLEITRAKSLIHIHECAKLMATSEPWITLQRSYEQSIAILECLSREVYVGIIGDEFVGFIIIVMQGAFKGYIQTVAVVPKWRNKGIGTKLLDFAEDRILKETPNVFMCVSSFNVDAQRLYKRLGYRIIGELENYIVNGESEILLRKTIASLAYYHKCSKEKM